MRLPHTLAIIAASCAVLGLMSSGFHGSVEWTSTIIYASLLAFIVKLGLALWILLRNPSARVNRFFTIVFIGQAIWDFGKFVMWLQPGEDSAFLWARISYSGFIISVFFLLDFVWAYLKKQNYFTRLPGSLLIYLPLAFVLYSLWFNHGVINHLIVPEEISLGYGIALWDYAYGPVYSYFFMWFQILPFLYAFSLFVYKYFVTENPEKKKQLLYLVIGSSFPIMIGIPTGVILPAMGVLLPPHNNILSLIMSIFLAVGIIRYKFLAIQPVGERIVPGRRIDEKLAKEYKTEFGHAYFIKHERSSEISHKVLLAELYKGHYGLILTSHNPSRIRHEYGIETTPIVWMTDTETEHLSVDPIDLEQIFETIRLFVSKVPNSFILIDGIDYLIAHNNFEKVLHFVRQVKSTIARSDDCVIIPKGNLVLDRKQEKLLESEFIVLPQASGRDKSVSNGELPSGKRRNFIIVGHNPLAQSIISEFEKRGITSTLVEKGEILVHYPKGAVNLVRGDPLSSKVLEHVGIGKPHTVVLITLDNDSDIILCINKIRQLSEDVTIITNIHNQNFVQIAMKAGADKVIPSSAIGGRMISLALTSPDIVRWVMDATTLSAKDLELTELRVDAKSPFIGKTVEEANQALGRSSNIIAVRDIQGLKQIPEEGYILKDGDILVLIADICALSKVKDISNKVRNLLVCKFR
jgi:Trk K+ transport system NAD-binding subunit